MPGTIAKAFQQASYQHNLLTLPLMQMQVLLAHVYSWLLRWLHPVHCHQLLHNLNWRFRHSNLVLNIVVLVHCYPLLLQVFQHFKRVGKLLCRRLQLVRLRDLQIYGKLNFSREALDILLLLLNKSLLTWYVCKRLRLYSQIVYLIYWTKDKVD